MGRRKDNPETIRNDILASAKELFSQFGFKKTAVDEIAKEAEVAKGTIYNYFKSKDEIVRTVFRKEQENLFELLKKTVQKETVPLEKLKKMMSEKIGEIIRSPLLKQVFSEPRKGLTFGLEQELERMDALETNLIADILKDFISLAEERINEIAGTIQRFLSALIMNSIGQDKLEALKKDCALLAELIFSGLEKMPKASM